MVKKKFQMNNQSHLHFVPLAPDSIVDSLLLVDLQRTSSEVDSTTMRGHPGQIRREAIIQDEYPTSFSLLPFAQLVLDKIYTH